MTKYYCIHGSTHNGNGTTSAEAASGGAVGAFNNAINCLDGSESSISNGDTVVFKTNHSGADIQITLSSTITILGGAVNAIRTYVFDDGTIWDGEGGYFYLDSGTGTSETITTQEYCKILGGADYRLIYTNYGTSEWQWDLVENSYFDGVHVRNLSTNSNACVAFYAHIDQHSHNGRLKLTYSRLPSSSTDLMGITLRGNYNTIDLVHFVFTGDAHKDNTAGVNYTLFDLYNFEGQYDIGTVIAEGLPTSMYLIENNHHASRININHFRHDNSEYQYNIEYGESEISVSDIKINGVGNFDFFKQSEDVLSTYETGKNYPVLSSVLPDLSTNWSIKAAFRTAVNEGYNRRTSDITNYFDQTSGTKTLTVEVLIYRGFVSPQDHQFFCIFTYEDTDGVMRSESTIDANGTIATSEAAWDTTNYGAINFDKHKFELVTAYSVKTGTLINARTYANINSTDADSFNYINPEIGVS
jgi:hypothetical protein